MNLIKPKTFKILEQKRSEFIDNFWMNLGDTSKIKTNNPFKTDDELERANPLLHVVNVMRKPENFRFTCEYLFNKRIQPFQQIVLDVMWNKPFPMMIGSRGMSKTFLLALHSMLRALFNQGSKVILTGAGFRQAKLIFEYCDAIWKESPLFQDILSNDKLNKPTRDVDRCMFRIGTSTIIAIPTGDGNKIRGIRSTDLICDEFGSIDPNIFEHIMQGFSSTHISPADNVEFLGRVRALKQLGRLTEEQADEQKLSIGSNRSIISGTCGYEFEHFCKYWKKYKSIIESRGNIDKLNEIFNGEIPLGFNWKDYAIIRLPYNLLPEGLIDIKAIGKAKATIHTGMFGIEYEAIFLKDSQGFFRRSLIEQCTCGKGTNPVSWPSCGEVSFCASLFGDYRKKYIMAIDPASEIDNFTIVILEIWQDHRRIVYCWSTTKDKFKAKLKMGLTTEHDFYRYCCRKIRELKRLFPTEQILVDSQGGGYQIQEILGDPTTLKDHESPIYPIIVEGEENLTDDMPGEHILYMVSFADAKWTNEANHGLRKDMESRVLVFPHIDSVALGMAVEEDLISGRVKTDPNDSSYEQLFDTLEDCVWEIEQLKEELTLIVNTKTANGRDHWDTPEIKTNLGKKGRLRKDRYSALLMANMGARTLAKQLPQSEYKHVGGIARYISNKDPNKKRNESLYSGPDWFVQQLRNNPEYGVSVNRGVK